MRSKFFVGSLLVIALAGGAFAAVVVEKKSRQVPYVEVFGCEGIHAFVFRGPTGTSRRPILVPPREYWTAQEAGLYSFVLRYHSGNVCSRLVTPEVFARYRVGEEFYDREHATGPLRFRRQQDDPAGGSPSGSASHNAVAAQEAQACVASNDGEASQPSSIAAPRSAVESPGSAGCQPALFGSLPKSRNRR